MMREPPLCAAKNWHRRHAARAALYLAVKTGQVKRGRRCEVCGSDGRVYGHHEDYALPLDVNWLCQICHVNRHCALKYDRKRRRRV